jgi:hypothetical protein
LLLATSTSAAGIVLDPLSEGPTWFLIPVALLLILNVRRPWVLLVIAALGALDYTIRPDQLAGVLAVVGLGVFAQLRPARDTGETRLVCRYLAGAAVVFVLIGLLPGLHNLIYDHRFRLVVATAAPHQDFPVALSDLPRLLTSKAVRATFMSQIRGIIVVGGQAKAGTFAVWAHLLQALWLLSLLVIAAHWRRLDWLTRAVGLLPLAFLGPLLFLEVYNYYPRHVVVGYIVLALSCVHTFSSVAGVHQAAEEQASGSERRSPSDRRRMAVRPGHPVANGDDGAQWP